MIKTSREAAQICIAAELMNPICLADGQRNRIAEAEDSPVIRMEMGQILPIRLATQDTTQSSLMAMCLA